MKQFLAFLGGLFLLLLVAGGLWWGTASESRKEALLEQFGLRQSPLATAQSGLVAMQKMNELTVLELQFLEKVTSTRAPMWPLPKSLFSSSKSLLMPGSVRYTLDMGALKPSDLSFDAARKTLVVRRPPLRTSEPSLLVRQAKDLEEMKDGALMLWLTRGEAELDRQNVAAITAKIRDEAQGAAYSAVANEEADKVIGRLFALPLAAAGFPDVKIIVQRPEPAR